ncbi:hypothetical protein D3C80_1394960 [compost metagenome]
MDATPVFLLAQRRSTAAHPPQSSEANSAIAGLRSNTVSVVWQAELCHSLLTDGAFAAQVAARFYRHGNGFLKVALPDRGFKPIVPNQIFAVPTVEDCRPSTITLRSTFHMSARKRHRWGVSSPSFLPSVLMTFL